MDSSLLMEMVHSQKNSESEKTEFVSQQFESVLVKQFLNDALKPMFKGVFNENSEGHRLYQAFFYGCTVREHCSRRWFWNFFDSPAAIIPCRKS